MTTPHIARQPAGVPVGGQFAATSHSEPELYLHPVEPVFRETLEGWPKAFAEPEVSFHFGDDNTITTTVSIDGEPAFDVWNPGDDIHSVESDTFVFDGVDNEEAVDSALDWSKAKHQQIADEVRAETHSAVERARHRVLAEANGVDQPVTDEELGTIVELNNAAVYSARKDGEHGAAALIARGVLKEHPDADTIRLDIDSSDDGMFVSGATVRDIKGVELGSYSGFDEGDERRGWTEHFSGLSPESGSAWWSDFTPPRDEINDEFTINLKEAASWTPGKASL